MNQLKAKIKLEFKDTPKKIMTLGWIIKDGKILLGRKKRGFATGIWNGLGGKVESGESIENSLKREFKEESNIDVLEVSKRAVLTFYYREPKSIMESHLFLITKYAGELSETEEIEPKWFKFANIPYAKMWPDDTIWMPYFLSNKTFSGSFLFSNYKEILDYKIYNKFVQFL